jgi:hypothetical protein
VTTLATVNGHRPTAIHKGVNFFREHMKMFITALTLAVLALPSIMAHAQEEPSLDIDMAPIFEQTNYWTSQLFPILAIGIGITIAIALIGFIGASVTKAFRGG